MGAAYAAPMGDGSPQQRGPTGWGDAEVCPGVCRCLRSAYGGWRPPAARAHRLRGRGVFSRRWSLPKQRLWGTVTPKDALLAVEGRGWPA